VLCDSSPLPARCEEPVLVRAAVSERQREPVPEQPVRVLLAPVPPHLPHPEEKLLEARVRAGGEALPHTLPAVLLHHRPAQVRHHRPVRAAPAAPGHPA
ncbi:Maf-like protein, partial [Clarias magur]